MQWASSCWAFAVAPVMPGYQLVLSCTAQRTRSFSAPPAQRAGSSTGARAGRGVRGKALRHQKALAHGRGATLSGGPIRTTSERTPCHHDTHNVRPAALRARRRPPLPRPLPPRAGPRARACAVRGGVLTEYSGGPSALAFMLWHVVLFPQCTFCQSCRVMFILGGSKSAAMVRTSNIVVCDPSLSYIGVLEPLGARSHELGVFTGRSSLRKRWLSRIGGGRGLAPRATWGSAGCPPRSARQAARPIPARFSLRAWASVSASRGEQGVPAREDVHRTREHTGPRLPRAPPCADGRATAG